MIKEIKEYFVITKSIDGYNSIDDEWFDTFEEARIHVNDKDENGYYKYSAYWPDSQMCHIERRILGYKQKYLETLDSWAYYEGKLDREHSYHYSKTYGEPEYEGKVW